MGKVAYARRKNESIPDTWGKDENGAAVTDPNKVATLQPMGRIQRLWPGSDGGYAERGALGREFWPVR